MSAPSFSSFPDFSALPHSGPSNHSLHSPLTPSTPKEERRTKRDTPHRSRNLSDKHKKHKRDKHRSDKSGHRSLDPSDDLTQLHQDERLKAEDDRKRKDSVLFYSDRKGDALNLQYGRLHAGDVPKYRLIGGGRKIFGLSNAWTALHRNNLGVEIGASTRRRWPSLTDPSSRKLLAAPPTRSLVNSETKYKYEEIDGFLRIPSRRGRQNDQSYRSITLVKDNSDSDSDSSEGESGGSSDEDEDGTSRPLTSHQQTLKSLEHQLASNPSSISTWLSLISQTVSTIPHTSKNATTTRSEITTSILSRAISAHPQNHASKALRLKYLKAGEEIWHESKLRAEWEDALKVGGVEIWMEWLEWRIRKGAKRINGVVDDAVRVLRSLGDGEDDEIGKLRVLWRVAAAFHNAGYTERATALFQAQAELTFEVPQSLYGLPLDTLLDALEEFWESEVPRVGEAGAKGWATWVSSGRPDHISSAPAQPKLATADPASNTTDPYLKWWYKETSADYTSRLPTRSTDDEEADPYATILFSDNRPLLLSLQSNRAKNVLRLVWLSFLGLHIPGLAASLSDEPRANWDDRWAFTHLTSPAYFAAIFPSGPQTRIIADSQAGVLIGREKEYASGFGPVKHWSLGVLGPLENIGKEKCGLWTKGEVVGGVDDAFVRRVFEQLRWGAEDVEWDCYALAFEAALSIKNALKLSRSFLSVAQDSLPHWAAHARLERLRGRIDDARKVYQTVLVASPPSLSRSGTSQLWWDWAEMEWLSGKPDAALEVVLRSAQMEGTTTASGVVLLRAKRSLEETFRGSESSSWKEREAWVKLRGLLELLTSSPAAALYTFDEHLLGHFSEGSVAHESLTVASLLMVYHHSTTLRNPTPPALLRDRLEKAIEVYPSNSVILGMFLEAEKGQGVWGRVRGLLGETTADGLGRDKDVPRRVAEVWVAGWERGRWEAEKERTRSGLAAAVENERTRGSPIIRRMFLEFEIQMGELEKAKKMLYIAIAECPLAKELYLLAFGPLRSVFSPRELNSFTDTMAERELRMRNDLDELLQGWIDESAKANEEIESDEDELEYNASELRRLMPY